ncbi:hypothetical protein ACLI1A_07060 [Flavobacterium sp. RHBU_3]|uniref:hypothetical protein n=1 Tax=Flavobacterium sp. RHBU_3 TaxID=3391184 RepID=UPI003984F41E
MIAQQFQELANQHDTQYYIKELKVSGTVGSKLPVAIYTLHIHHRDIPINIKFEFGNHNLAEFDFELPHSATRPDFVIEARDVFERLFSFNKNRWKINCEHGVFKSSLLNLVERSTLNELAKQEAFEPKITGKKTPDSYTVKVVYYLGFNNKEQSLKVVTNFCTSLIDFIIDSKL